MILKGYFHYLYPLLLKISVKCQETFEFYGTYVNPSSLFKSFLRILVPRILMFFRLLVYTIILYWYYLERKGLIWVVCLCYFVICYCQLRQWISIIFWVVKRDIFWINLFTLIFDFTFRTFKMNKAPKVRVELTKKQKQKSPRKSNLSSGVKM